LAEVRILRSAVRHEARIGLWQGLASPATLWRSSQDRNDAIYKKAIAAFGIPPHKSCLLAGAHELDTSRLPRCRIRRTTRNQTKKKHTEDGVILPHVYLHVSSSGQGVELTLQHLCEHLGSPCPMAIGLRWHPDIQADNLAMARRGILSAQDELSRNARPSRIRDPHIAII
jgi:hypothetical protein